ncbi:MAG: helix-turn-helix transcriptional regulator [Halioglobus sp.]
MPHSLPVSLLPTAISALGHASFPQHLLNWLKEVAAFDSAVIMGYPEHSALTVLHNALHAGDQPGFGGAYRDGLWLLSPLYLAARSGRRGYFHILDIAPPNFADSDYYALYYRSNGVADHTGFLVESGGGIPLAISLERTPALGPYTETEKTALADAGDVVAALVRKHWPGSLEGTMAGQTDLHAQVQKVLQAFGSSLLTPRERDVVQLVLRGYPSKAVASSLGISAQTEQVHRKNIYHKLGLSSHNALFSLFFDALAQPLTDNQDPIPDLLSQRGHS